MPLTKTCFTPTDYASEDSLHYLNQRLRQTNGTLPKYYQVLLKVAVDNGIPTTISVVTVHEPHSDKQ